jgi:hypothetical protein
MDMQRHVTIIAVLQIGFGAIFLIVGIFAFIFLTGIGFISQDTEAVGVLGFIGTIGFLLMLILGAPTIIAGIGLLKHQSWARILTMILACFYLLAVPIGTALGIYSLWVMTERETTKLFSVHPQTQPPPVQAA